ncbi:hypothetical protein H257_17989 [Aphanomyces astaci]|uniref:DDE Tnp4 domain-containing protein n=1 Tax=Aphanomyces astaci TaxID=112090 RepID=W4FCT3_APHAT|nr:hypothetical protein H257_17989 [Aphanomyces astaci]ETV65280.1 hypothetical protein H257_17989 [Aphanomyces astaci]|eukprot:XP_009845281.1 hypothetical protein H257_17989 [Aphanomyces astaci]
MRLPSVLRNRDVVLLLTALLEQCHGDFDTFLDTLEVLIRVNVLRLRAPRPLINYNHNFDRHMDAATARTKFRFSIDQLAVLCVKLGLPEFTVTPWHDKDDTVEAVAIVCRRMAETCHLYTIASEFGRSLEACSRIINTVVNAIYRKWHDVMYFHECLTALHADSYADAIETKSGLRGMKTCIAFIDGTKQFISHPTPRPTASEPENLQRVVYNGHLRRHCLNWQGVSVLDGIIVGMYGPVEGRHHDSTMLSMSCLLDRFKANPVLARFCLYGDPAYGCRQCLSCPFANAMPGTFETVFNSSMSSVRESVEWSFHLVKGLWSYVSYDKKMKPDGNQISMYFDVKPPSLDEYLSSALP